MNDVTTTNLSEFGARELYMLEELLKAMREQGLPDDFYDDEKVFIFFLTTETRAFLMNY